jgi:hypothetical protein
MLAHVYSINKSFRKIDANLKRWSKFSLLQYHTPLNKFLRGIRPRGTTFEFEYLCEFETKFKTNLGYDSGAYMRLIYEKTEAKNMPKIAEVKLSRCGLEVADFRKNCDCGATFLLKVAEFRLQKCFLQIAELQLRTQKKVARALLWMCSNFKVETSIKTL